jgi:hypothetical protein
VIDVTERSKPARFKPDAIAPVRRKRFPTTIEIVRAERLKTRLKCEAVAALVAKAIKRAGDYIGPPPYPRPKAIIATVVEIESARRKMPFDKRRTEACRRWFQEPTASSFDAIFRPMEKKRPIKPLAKKKPTPFAGKERR